MRKPPNEYIPFYIGELAAHFTHNLETGLWQPKVFRIVTPERCLGPSRMVKPWTYDLAFLIRYNEYVFLDFVWGGGWFSLEDACLHLHFALKRLDLGEIEARAALPNPPLQVPEHKWRTWHGFQ
jgi:hypothetical protein